MAGVTPSVFATTLPVGISMRQLLQCLWNAINGTELDEERCVTAAAPRTDRAPSPRACCVVGAAG
jgi:hypothetical protein